MSRQRLGTSVCFVNSASLYVNRFSDLTTQLAAACLCAGVITTVAVAQGQNPMTALGITLFSAVAAVMVGQVL